MQIQYLEIVTPDVDAVCATHARLHGVSFSEPQAGGEIAHPPMELPGHGKFAIFIQGGVQHGLWQV
jgi:hypothetical protein